MHAAFAFLAAQSVLPSFLDRDMKKLSVLVSALCLSLSAVTVLTAVSSSVAIAEEQKVSAKVGKPLQEAIADGQAKKWDDAVAKLREAQGVDGKSAFDEFKINEILGWVYFNQKKFAEGAAAYEKTLDGGFLSGDAADQRLKQITSGYLQAKQYPKAMDYLQRWLKTHPNDSEMSFVLAQLQSQTGQLKQSKDTVDGLISNAEKAGQRPKEDWLKLSYGVSYKLNDSSPRLDKATLNTVEKLLRYYPSPTYWEAYLVGLKAQLAQQPNSDGTKFQLFRLMLDVGAIKNSDDYIELAQLANSFGYPGEAVSVLEAGFNNKVLGVNEQTKERENRLLANMKKNAETDRATLPALDKKARAAGTGQDDVVLGEAYLGYGQTAQAIEALERGIKEGSLKKPDQAELALGIAYLRNKQKDQAKAAFKQVTADSDLGRIASLWILHATGS